MSYHENMVRINDDSFEVCFAPVQVDKQRCIEIELVLDFNEKDEVIGIEIINLVYCIKKQYQSNSFLFNKIFSKIEQNIYFSYDQDADAFYLSLSDTDLSVDQRVVDGILIFDEEMHLVSIRFILR